MQKILVKNLDGEELNYWVAKAQGKEVMGKFLAYYDPEAGYPEFQSRQKESHQGCMKTHWRYFYINECKCELIAEMEQENRKFWTENHPELPYRSKPIFAGHDASCFEPVVDYCSDWGCGGSIIERFNIGVRPVGKMNEQGQYSQWQGSFYDQDGQIQYVEAHTPLIAIMRALVVSRFSETIEVSDNPV
jgi:hypothetical protein